jgi:hypothetical protein
MLTVRRRCEMPRWMAAIVAILTVVLSSFGGMIVGAFVGNLIVPARFGWGRDSDPGLLLVGALLGLLGGFYFGIWAAMGIGRSDRTALDIDRPDELTTT